MQFSYLKDIVVKRANMFAIGDNCDGGSNGDGAYNGEHCHN